MDHARTKQKLSPRLRPTAGSPKRLPTTGRRELSGRRRSFDRNVVQLGVRHGLSFSHGAA
eukprot:8500714-Alexandrium_andersonii.AAC.1